jgi:hypothetical protein
MHMNVKALSGAAAIIALGASLSSCDNPAASRAET